MRVWLDSVKIKHRSLKKLVPKFWLIKVQFNDFYSKMAPV